MKHRLSELISNHGLKHWSIKGQRDVEFIAWVYAETSDLSDASFMIRAYCATHDERPTCANGKQRKLKGIQQGWGFCGKTGVCECARQSVSASVSASKASQTDEQKAITQAKREVTNLEVYGHRNSAQTDEAKAAHVAFYADRDNIRNQLRKQAQTMMTRHGVTNAAHLPEAVQKRHATLVERYGVTNPMQHSDFAARSLATRLSQGYAQEYYLRNYNRLKQRLHTDCDVELLTPFTDYNGVVTRPILDFQCISCSRLFSWRLDYSHLPRCYVCHPTPIAYKSQEELQVLEYITSDLGISNVLSGDRRLIAPYELDILSEQHRVAIEYCGLYWHSELQRPNRRYHLHKLEAVKQQGYQLLTVFSDEWVKRPEIVKSKIRHLFGQVKDRRFARNLRITEVEAKIAAQFYDGSHIQGATLANTHIALIDSNDTILALMSFSLARSSKGLGENAYELVRYATLPHTIVVGGASRLFSHFRKTRQPAAVISYADRRWSDGHLYRQLNFTLEGINPPSYSYIIDYTTRYFRFNFRKDILVSILGIGADDDINTITEWDMMRALDYDRIWDCGTYRFVWYPK